MNRVLARSWARNDVSGGFESRRLSLVLRSLPRDDVPNRSLPRSLPSPLPAGAFAGALQRQALAADALRLSALELDADKMEAKLRGYDVNLWDLGYDDLKTLVLHMFRSSGLLRMQTRDEFRRWTSAEAVELNAGTLSTFIDHVSDHYWCATRHSAHRSAARRTARSSGQRGKVHRA